MTKMALIFGILFLLIFFGFSGCSSGGDSLGFPLFEELDFEKGLVFFEQWVRIEGEPGPPYIFIDFPTYRFLEGEGILISFNGTFGSDEGKIDLQTTDLIVGEGTLLSGSAGSGAASGLQGVTDFPFVTGCSVLSIKEIRPDGSLLLQKSEGTVTFFKFTFPNPVPSGTFLIRPGERLEYTVTRNLFLAGTMRKLILTVILRCTFIDRSNCQNGNWGDM